MRCVTSHQKPLLIDYDHDGGSKAVGYIMGLNSVTDYWDTQEHNYTEEKRGQSWEGHAEKGFKDLKPYQDYAAQLKGEVLVSVNKNFCTAWDKADKATKKPDQTQLMAKRKSTPPKLSNAGKDLRLQVLRTQPEEGYKDKKGSHKFDKTIKRAYFHASTVARHYLYLENQYFFYEEWARHLKENRLAYAAMAQKGGSKKETLPKLHLIAVIPNPELDEMVPRTHDTLKSLGQGGAMPNQNQAIEEAQKKYNEVLARQQQWDARRAKLNPAAQMNAVSILGPRPEARPDAVTQTSMQVKAAKEVGEKDKVIDGTTKEQVEAGVLMQDGKSLHMKALVCKMVTGNGLGKYRDIYIHSKLLMADDHYLTLGSANLNQRSMAADSEINIATDNQAQTKGLRARVWGQLTGNEHDGGDGTSKIIAKAFDDWKTLSEKNAKAVGSTKTVLPFTGFIVKFSDPRATTGTRRG